MYTEVRRQLNGQCGDACPIRILASSIRNNYPAHFLRQEELKQDFCYKVCKRFHFIKHKTIQTYCHCPCLLQANPEEIFLYLDDIIEELEFKLSKEFSF
jgi:hypothetical protein